MVSTPNRFLRAALGAAINYKRTNINIYFCNNCSNSSTRFFQFENTYIGLDFYLSLSLWDGDYVTLLQNRFMGNALIKIYENRESKYEDDDDLYFDNFYIHTTLLSVSYHF